MLGFEDEEDVTRYVVWAERAVADAGSFRALLDGVRCLIDFDGTIAAPRSMAPLPSLRGRPLAEFLAEAPYAVQTWNPVGAMRFFLETHPTFPRPRCILIAPMRDVFDDEGVLSIGKDFTLFGITGASIIDDMPAASIRAPGCVILPP